MQISPQEKKCKYIFQSLNPARRFWLIRWMVEVQYQILFFFIYVFIYLFFENKVSNLYKSKTRIIFHVI